MVHATMMITNDARVATHEGSPGGALRLKRAMSLERHNEVCNGLVASLYQAILIIHVREVGLDLPPCASPCNPCTFSDNFSVNDTRPSAPVCQAMLLARIFVTE